MKQFKPILLAFAYCVAAIPLLAGPAASALSGKEEPRTENSIFDKIWGLGKLYKDDSNPLIEEFDFTGRYQGDYFNVYSRRGDKSEWETRRFRFGAEAYLFERHIVLKATIESDPNNDILYNRFTDLNIRWQTGDAFNVTVGKIEPRFGYDREFSDRFHLVFERGFFDDQLYTRNDYAAAATVDGKIGNLGYLVGVFSDDVNREFGNFRGGYSYLGEINYDFSKALTAEKAFWVFDYLHNETNSRSNTFTRFDEAFASYFDFKKGSFGLVAQVNFGHAGDNVWGFMLMPIFDVTKRMQVVARYQLGLASEDNGIATLNHEFKTVGKFTGDTYHTGYLGVNYYIYSHKLKLMTGLQYESLAGGIGPKAGNNGWTAISGIRLYW